MDTVHGSGIHVKELLRKSMFACYAITSDLLDYF